MGSWQSLLAAVWEQVTGFSIIMAMLCLRQVKWNYTTPPLQTMSRTAFAAYIIHPLVIISVTLLLKGWLADPAIKLLVVAPVIVPVTFSRHADYENTGREKYCLTFIFEFFFRHCPKEFVIRQKWREQQQKLHHTNLPLIYLHFQSYPATLLWHWRGTPAAHSS